MKICMLGSFDPTYTRNKILLDGISKNNAKVFQCRSMSGNFLIRYPELIRQFWKIRKEIDIIFVAFVGHLNVPLAFLLGKLFKKKVVFDMFYSMFDTYVYDRKSISEKSLKAKSLWLIDKIAATLSDIVITDTNTHADYFSELLGIKRSKFRNIFIGGDDTVFYPRKGTKSDNVIVEFHGEFSRLQGVEVYIKAAKFLEKEKNLLFLLIGNTQRYPNALELYRKLKPKNMLYMPTLPVLKLAEVVATADISIGHQGGTRKALSVISNKMYHALASGTALIALDSPAARELLQDKRDVLFNMLGDVNDLAKKIKYMATHPAFRKYIAKNGYTLHKHQLTNKLVGKKLIHELNPFVHRA